MLKNRHCKAWRSMSPYIIAAQPRCLHRAVTVFSVTCNLLDEKSVFGHGCGHDLQSQTSSI